LWLQLGDFELVWAEINGKGSMGRRRHRDGWRESNAGMGSFFLFSFFFLLARHFHLVLLIFSVSFCFVSLQYRIFVFYPAKSEREKAQGTPAVLI
jgi:hypothetical protein